MKLTHKTNSELIISGYKRSREQMHRQAQDQCLCLGIDYVESDFIETYDHQEAKYFAQRELNDTDWRAAKANDIGVPMSDAWKKYRQDLRDIINSTSTEDITWPTKPS